MEESQQNKEFIPAVILLTDNKPIQCKHLVWAKESTADYMPNYTDLRFPYKTSSILCPWCGKPLTGTPIEIKEQEPDEEKPRAKKVKTKPWDIHLREIRHEREEDWKNCPLNKIQESPSKKIMTLVEACHKITWTKALQESLSQPKNQRDNSSISQELLKNGNIPKLITQIDKEPEKEKSNEENF